MISQKTRAQIAYAYGFKGTSTFSKYIQDNNLDLQSYRLLDQNAQIELYAKMGIPKGLEEEEKTILLPMVKTYQLEHNLPFNVYFLLPKTRKQIAKAYGYNCTRTFTRHLQNNEIDLVPNKPLNQEAQVELYAKMGIPKGLEEEEKNVVLLMVIDYCKKHSLPPPYYDKLDMSNFRRNCPVLDEISTCILAFYPVFLQYKP